MKQLALTSALLFTFLLSITGQSWEVVDSVAFTQGPINIVPGYSGSFGFSLSGFGATGNINDQCARSQLLGSSYYLSFEETLSDTFEYRIRWNMKTTETSKVIQLKYNTSAGASGTNIGSPHTVPTVSSVFGTPGVGYTSSTFSGLSGTYHLILTTGTGNDTSTPSDYCYFDDYILERRAISVSYPEISLFADQLSVNEGQGVEVCVVTNDTTEVSINLQLIAIGGTTPHLDNYSTLNFTIPAQTSDSVCTTLYTDPDDGIANDDGVYSIKLVGPDTSGTTSNLDTLQLTVIDAGATITFTPDTLTITEGSSGQVCFQISGPPSSAVDVDLVLSSSNGPHFTTYSTQTATFPSGQSANQCIQLSPDSTGVDPDSNYVYLFIPQTSDTTISLTGSLVVIVEEPDSTGCNFDFDLAVNNAVCADNSTPADPSDDLFAFDLLVNRSDMMSGTWIATINGQDTSGSYGIALTLGGYAIAGGDLTIYLTDSVNNTCLDTLLVSAPISLGNEVMNIVCDDSGTPNTSTDDVFYFDIVVSRSDTASGIWETTIAGQVVSGNYGDSLQLGPYAISGGNLSFTIEDDDGLTCEIQQDVTAPGTCSNGTSGNPAVVFTRNWETVIEGDNAPLCVKLTPADTFPEDVLAEIRLVSNRFPHLGNYQTQHVLIEAGQTNALCISVQTSFIPSQADTINEYQFVIRNARTVTGDTVDIGADSLFTLRVVDIHSPTTLYTGDIIFIGFDNYVGNEKDRIVITNLVPLGAGTQFSIANAKYCSTDGLWYSRDDNDGTIAAQLITYTGPDELPAGSTICIDIPGVGTRDELLLNNFKLNGEPTDLFSVRNEGQNLDPDVNLLTTMANDLYLMQGDWTFNAESGRFNGTVMSRLQIGDPSSWIQYNCSGGSDLPADLECVEGPTTSSTGSLYGFFDCSEYGSAFSTFDYLALAADATNWDIQSGNANLNLESYACDSICSLTSDSLYWMTPPQILVIDCDTTTESTINQWLGNYGNGVVSGTCGGPITVLNNFTGDLMLACSPDTMEVVFTALDTCDNRASIIGQIVIDSIAPPIFVQQPQDTTVYCDDLASIPSLFQDWLANHGGAQISSFCGEVDIQFTAIGEPYINCRQTDVTFFAVNTCGDTTYANTVVFEVIDNTDPVIGTSAQNLTVNCNDTDFEDQIDTWLKNHGNATATDNCSPHLSWQHDFTEDAYECGTTQITFTARDNCGNTATTSANLIVQDDVAPQITYAPSSLQIIVDLPGFEARVNDLLSANANIIASDNCSSELIWTHNYNNDLDSTDCGEALITFIVSDGCGNTDTTDVLFQAVDVKNPSITVQPQDLVIHCDETNFYSQVHDWLGNSGGATATDNVTETLTWSFDTTSTYIAQRCGEYPVTFTVSDSCDNSLSTQASIVVIDTVAPVVSVYPDTLRLAFDDPNFEQSIGNWLESAGNAVVTDNCVSNLFWLNDYRDSSFVFSEDSTCFQQEVTFSAWDLCGGGVILPTTIIEVYRSGLTLIDSGSDLELPCACQAYYPEAIAWLDSIAGIELDYCSLTPYEVSHTALDDQDLYNCQNQSVTFTITQPGSTDTITVTRQIIMTDTDCDAAVQSSGSDLTVTCGEDYTTAVNNWVANHAGIVLEDICGEFFWDTVIVNYTALDDCLDQTITFSGEDRCNNPISVQRQILVDCDLSVEIEEVDGQLCAEVTGYCPNDVSYDWNNSVLSTACITPPPTISGNYQVSVTCNVGSGNDIFCQEVVSPIYYYDACGSVVEFDPQCPTSNYDILFVMDTESSITNGNFDDIEASILEVMNDIESQSQSASQVRYAVVSYYGPDETQIYWIRDWNNSPPSSITRPANGFDCANLNPALGVLNGNMHSPRAGANLHLVILTDSPESDGCDKLTPYSNADSIKTNYSATISVVRYKNNALTTGENTTANSAAANVASSGYFYYYTSFSADLDDVKNDIFGCMALTASAQMNCGSPAYSWSASNGGQITGSATSSTININGLGTYAVTVSCGDSCIVNGSYNLSSLGSGGGSSLVAEENLFIEYLKNEPNLRGSPHEEDLKINVFPNPNTGLFYLEVISNQPREIEVSCFNTSSEKVLFRQPTIREGTNQLEINGANLPSGIYLLRIQSVDDVIYHRVVITH